MSEKMGVLPTRPASQLDRRGIIHACQQFALPDFPGIGSLLKKLAELHAC